MLYLTKLLPCGGGILTKAIHTKQWLLSNGYCRACHSSLAHRSSRSTLDESPGSQLSHGRNEDVQDQHCYLR